MRRSLAPWAALLTAFSLAAVPVPAAADAADRRPLSAVNLPAGGRVLFYLGQDSSTLAAFDADVLATLSTYGGGIAVGLFLSDPSQAPLPDQGAATAWA